MNTDMLEQIEHGDGFIAALDQSGGSTPKALALYGVAEDSYSGEEEMFDVMHAMRSRIMTSPAFTGERVLGAILFEQTMDRTVEGRDTPSYLWDVKHVVPFLKVDKGLADEADGVQVMKPIPGLDELLARAVAKGVFGTKMRSVVKLANEAGVDAVVAQQFDVGQQILDAGLVPIIEPEVDIHSPEKAAAEGLLKAAILRRLDALAGDDRVMLKLSLPTDDGFYADLIDHPEGDPRRRAVRWLPARRGQRDPCPQPGHDRQLLPGPHRGPHRAAERRRVQHRPRPVHRQHLRGVQGLILALLGEPYALC